MSLDQLDDFLIDFLEKTSSIDCTGGINRTPVLKAEFQNILTLGQDLLPSYHGFIKSLIDDLSNSRRIFRLNSAVDAVILLQNVVFNELKSKIKIKEGKIFDTAYDKIEQASECFRNSDNSSTFHNLNTSLELMLKDKLEIPSTFRGINTSNIIEIMVKYQAGPFRYLDEAKKRIVEIDNKIKHQAYKPSKKEAIDAIKIMEELWGKLEHIKLEISPEILDEIYNKIFK